MTLLPIHILAGTIAIVPGFIALFARKGGKWHRRSGMIFVYAMLILAASGAVMAAFQPNRGNVMGGVVTFYLVTTGLLTMRRRGAGIDWKDVGAMLLGVSAGSRDSCSPRKPRICPTPSSTAIRRRPTSCSAAWRCWRRSATRG